jgi:hypothetical protein
VFGCASSRVITRGIISAEPDTPVADIATLFDVFESSVCRLSGTARSRHHQPREPHSSIQALATSPKKVPLPQPVADAEVRENVVSPLNSEHWVQPFRVNVTVTDGTADLWGLIDASLFNRGMQLILLSYINASGDEAAKRTKTARLHKLSVSRKHEPLGYQQWHTNKSCFVPQPTKKSYARQHNLPLPFA